MDFDNYERSLNYLYLGLQKSLGDKLGVGPGFNYYGMKLESSNPDLNGDLKLRHYGPMLVMSAYFQK